ncbi:aspartate 1-decarboxylase [Candidatus Poribacteria bacterium]|nr:aspartate 1-decarboxylase [Candidatus Poribacteria bacterium]
MLREMCKSKIHRATVTEVDLNYEGSLTIDEELMEAADIAPYEKVQVYNINNGARFETYAIPGERRSGVICVNGAAARLAQPGDLIIIVTYALYDESELEKFSLKVVFVDSRNRIVQVSP